MDKYSGKGEFGFFRQLVGGFPCSWYSDVGVSTTCIKQDTDQLAFYSYEKSAVTQMVFLDRTENQWERRDLLSQKTYFSL